MQQDASGKEPQPAELSPPRRVWFRKQLVLPAEHGAWAWLLVPFLVGVGVAGRVNTAVWLVLIGGLAAFLLRQPATAWLRLRQGKGRRADAPLAAGWTLGLAAVAMLCLTGLLALGHLALLRLLGPLAALLALYLAAASQRRASLRAMWLELAGAAGLAVMAPAVLVAADGRLTGAAWGVWAVLAALNMLGALYVRARLAVTRQRPFNRPLLLGSHLAGFLLAGTAAWSGAIPWLAASPFAGLLARAVWTAVRPRPVPHIKRFGFLETGIALGSGLLVVMGYWVAGATR